MLKTGRQHIDTLKDGREVFINGGKADDVTTHPAFRNMVATVGELYDYQSRSENVDLMTFEIPAAHGGKDGDRANRIWQLPTSYDELVERRRALESWTGIHAGFLGRAPDHVASCISGMYMGLEVFEADNPDRAAALRAVGLHELDADALAALLSAARAEKS